LQKKGGHFSPCEHKNIALYTRYLKNLREIFCVSYENIYINSKKENIYMNNFILKYDHFGSEIVRV
jgi:hypothetical protein